MSQYPIHVSVVLSEALNAVGGVRGQFRGVRLNDFTYPNFHTAESTLFDYRLPFEDCGSFALGHAVEPRRFVVPGMLLEMQDTTARKRLIKAIAGLYCAAFLDRASAGYHWVVQNRPAEVDLIDYIIDVRQLVARFENAVGLLTAKPEHCQSVVSLLRGVPHLADAMAQAMQEAFRDLIKPTLVYSDEGLRALNIHTKFAPGQWLEHLHRACNAAREQAPQFPPLPRLVRADTPNDDTAPGYDLCLYDIEPAPWLAACVPQNQPGAMHQACAS